MPLVVSLPVLGVLFGYSYTKRFTSLAHFWLGLALMLAPICTWLAVRGLVVVDNPADLVPAVVLGLAVLFWVSGFDMIYACQDYEFDREAKLNSIPVRLGVAGALATGGDLSCDHDRDAGVAAAVCISGWGRILDWAGFIGWTISAVAVLLVYEHSLVRPDDLTRVNIAFFNVNAIVSMGLFVATSLDLLVI